MSTNKKELRELGFKATQPRLKILKLFENYQDEHFTADEIYERLKAENIGIATVYRVLNQFEAVGLINRLKLDNDQIKYELNDGQHHDHIICVKCGTIQEFCNEELKKLQEKIVQNFNAKIIDYSLNIYVECKSC